MSTWRRGGTGVWGVLADGPRAFLASWWPWRSLAYVLTGWVVATVWLAAVASLMVVPAFGLGVLLAGIPLAAVSNAAGSGWSIRRPRRHRTCGSSGRGCGGGSAPG